MGLTLPLDFEEEGDVIDPMGVGGGGGGRRILSTSVLRKIFNYFLFFFLLAKKKLDKHSCLEEKNFQRCFFFALAKFFLLINTSDARNLFGKYTSFVH